MGKRLVENGSEYHQGEQLLLLLPKSGTYRERLLVRMNDEDVNLPMQSTAW